MNAVQWVIAIVLWRKASNDIKLYVQKEFVIIVALLCVW